jgi:hypothetical protein
MARATIEHAFADGATVTSQWRRATTTQTQRLTASLRVVELYRLAVADSE